MTAKPRGSWRRLQAASTGVAVLLAAGACGPPPPQTVTVWVADGGAPVAGCRVAFESVSGPGVPEIGLISGEDGASSLALEPGDYRALAECDSGAASATFTVDDQPLDVRLSL